MPPVAFLNPYLRTSPLDTVAVIPARYHSSRLPGKPLADIAGRPMIEHVYRQAAAAAGIDAVVVATDDDRIVEAVERFGGVARLTGAGHRTGTDRVAEIARDLPCRIVVNVQGDVPLVEPGMLAELLSPFGNEGVVMSTLRQRVARADDLASPHVVKVVVDQRGDALYFSRAPIPFRREGAGTPGFKHIGLYAFRREFLLTFAALPQTPLEISESLEQLRALEHGFRIRTVATEFDSIEVDTPEDLERVRHLLAARV